MLTVELISLNGRSEGAVARLREGYWMIGRHRECQIRPRSSSVSDRHCLIRVQENLVGVFDLENETGTFVNEVELEQQVWKRLRNDDEIRCGKIKFQILIHKPTEEKDDSGEAFDEDVIHADQSTVAEPENEEVALSKSLPDLIAQSTGGTGEVGSSTAWFESGFAEALGTEAQAQQIDDLATDKVDVGGDEVDLFNDDTIIEDDGDPTPVEPERDSKKKKKAKKKNNTPKLSRPKPAKPKRERSRSLPSLSFRDPEQLKLIAAATAALLLVSFFAYRVVQSVNPPPPELRQGID